MKSERFGWKSRWIGRLMKSHGLLLHIAKGSVVVRVTFYLPSPLEIAVSMESHELLLHIAKCDFVVLVTCTLPSHFPLSLNSNFLGKSWAFCCTMFCCRWIRLSIEFFPREMVCCISHLVLLSLRSRVLTLTLSIVYWIPVFWGSLAGFVARRTLCCCRGLTFTLVNQHSLFFGSHGLSSQMDVTYFHLSRLGGTFCVY